MFERRIASEMNCHYQGQKPILVREEIYLMVTSNRLGLWHEVYVEGRNYRDINLQLSGNLWQSFGI